MRRGFLTAIALFVALGAVGVFGVRSTTTASPARKEYRLSVRYPHVTRAGLPASITIRVRHDGGFDEPITIAMTRTYLGLFDEQGVRPEPDASTSEGTMLVWEFEAPDEGNTFTVNLDVIVETGRHFGDDAIVEVRDGRGAARASVALNTRIVP